MCVCYISPVQTEGDEVEAPEEEPPEEPPEESPEESPEEPPEEKKAKVCLRCPTVSILL